MSVNMKVTYIIYSDTSSIEIDTIVKYLSAQWIAKN